MSRIGELREVGEGETEEEGETEGEEEWGRKTWGSAETDGSRNMW